MTSTGASGPTGVWRRRATVVGAWVLVVVVGSLVTFLVVDRAGREVLDPAASSADRAADLVPSTGAAVTPTGSPVAPTAPAATASPAPGTATSPDATPEPEPPPAPPPAAAPIQRTEGGTVVVACDGSAVSLSNATPATGWRMDIREQGPDEVRVRFRTGDGESEGEVDVRGRCVGGAPAFGVERD